MKSDNQSVLDCKCIDLFQLWKFALDTECAVHKKDIIKSAVVSVVFSMEVGILCKNNITCLSNNVCQLMVVLTCTRPVLNCTFLCDRSYISFLIPLGEKDFG